MKRFSKELFAVIMLLALILGLSSTFAFADPEEVEPTDLDLQSVAEYNLWLGDIRVTDDNKDDILGDGTASFDPSTHTLTLNNPTIAGVHDNGNGVPCKILSKEMDLTITGSVSVEGATYGIYVRGAKLTLGSSASDSITAKGSKAGIWASGNIYVNAGTITAEGGTYGLASSDFDYCDIFINDATVIATSTGEGGLYSGHRLTVKNSAITAAGKDSGVQAGNEITIENSAVEAKATSGNGIYCSWGLTLTNSETVASGAGAAINTRYYSTTINGGTLTATGGTGISGGFTMNGDDTVVNITAGTGCDGIRPISNDVTITGGTLTIAGKSSGITTQDSKSVSISNATVNLQGAIGINSAGSISINNATVTGNSSNDTQVNITRATQVSQAFACGLQAAGSINIDESTVTLDVVNNATGGINIGSTSNPPEVSVQTCGMKAGSGITIEDSTVTATSLSKTAFTSGNRLTEYVCGLQAGSGITISSDSDVTAKGTTEDGTTTGYPRAGYGAYSASGNISVSASNLDATGNSEGAAILADQGSVAIVEPCIIALPREYTFEEGGSTVYEADGTTVAQHVIIVDKSKIPNVPYIDAADNPLECEIYTTVTSEQTRWDTGWYVVSDEVTIPSRVAVSGDVNLILCDDAKLTASKGITVHADNHLTIWCQAGKSGQLIANSSGGDAGIGSVSGGWLGDITINGGVITARGSIDGSYDGGAAIGGGVRDGTMNNPVSGSITINGGTIDAQASQQTPVYGGAGIGGGRGNTTKITINGGNITAKGGLGGAGIGSGYLSRNIDTITITGGDIYATTLNNYASAIGGGHNSERGTITISGGHVQAIAGNQFGIGGGGGTADAETIIKLTWESADQDMSVYASHFGRNASEDDDNKTFLLKDFVDLDTGEVFSGSTTELADASILDGRTLVPVTSILLTIPITVEMGQGHGTLASSWAASLPADYQATAEGTLVSMRYPRITSGHPTSLKTAQSALNENLFHFLADYTPAYYDNEEAFMAIAQHPISDYSSKGQVDSEMNASTGTLPNNQTFYTLWEVPLRAVDITLEAPLCGEVTVTDGVQNPTTVVSTETAGVHIGNNWWLASGSSWNKFAGQMVAGNEYTARIEVVADFGYSMGWNYLDDDNVKVNGVKATVIAKSADMWQIKGTATAEHNWGEWETVTPATYTDDGLEKRVCANCEAEETRVIPMFKSFMRLYGSDRYATGAAIAGAYGAHGGTVILATGDNFPDALCASALAGKEGAPILMTSSKSLSADTAHTLASIQPSRIIVVGGVGAVPDSVLRSACTAAGISFDDEHTDRYYGSDRFATGVSIYRDGGLGGDTCIIATGGNFADALSISPYAYATATPIFLADTKTGKLNAATANAISGQFSRVIIVGGTGVVSDDVVGQVGASSSVRLAGDSRYGTSIAIAEWEMGANDQAAFGPAEHISVSHVSLATGANFPDALTGGALCGKNLSLLLLVSEKQADYGDALALVGATTSGIEQGYIFGGTGAVSDALKAQFDEALNH